MSLAVVHPSGVISAAGLTSDKSCEVINRMCHFCSAFHFDLDLFVGIPVNDRFMAVGVQILRQLSLVLHLVFQNRIGRDRLLPQDITGIDLIVKEHPYRSLLKVITERGMDAGTIQTLCDLLKR